MKNQISQLPEILIKNQPIDIELCALLGEKQSDFVVLCFDGVPLEFFGTPHDSPDASTDRQALVDALNDQSKNSSWPKMFSNWKQEICEQFKLPVTTTAKDYRPVVSLKISRVCHGYSEHLHAAIGLFEKVADKLEWWSVGKMPNGKASVILTANNGREIDLCEDSLSLAIVQAVIILLKMPTK